MYQVHVQVCTYWYKARHSYADKPQHMKIGCNGTFLNYFYRADDPKDISPILGAELRQSCYFFFH